MREINKNLIGYDAMRIVILFSLLLLNNSSAFGKGLFITQSDYYHGPYEFIGYISSISTANPYEYIQNNMQQHVDECIKKLSYEAINRKANGILSLRWNIKLSSENNKWYVIECHGMAIKKE